MTYHLDAASMGFTRNPLNRHSELRENEAQLAAFRQDPAARMLAFAREMPVLDAERQLLNHQNAAALGAFEEQVFLGLWDGRPIFAATLSDEASAIVSVADQGGLLDTRQIVLRQRPELGLIDARSLAVQGLVSAELLGLIAQAKAVLHWHSSHRFCGRCGAASLLAAAGWRRDCPACKAQHFPRTDPVVIMLAVDRDRCLLGRQARFPKGMYSCLAGFLESGETLEDGVRRELFEEAGITTGTVHYLASQPWPFPASLMIGAIAEAEQTTLTIDQTELEDARWFSRAEAALLLAGQHPQGLSAPVPMAIAHHILKAWIDAG